MAGKKLEELQAFFVPGSLYSIRRVMEDGETYRSHEEATHEVRELLASATLWHTAATLLGGREDGLHRRIAELEAENAGLKSAIDTQAAIIAQHENAEGDAVSRARQDVREHMWRMETDRDNKVMELRAENAMLRRKVAGVESVIDGTKAVRTVHIERMLRLAEDPE